MKTLIPMTVIALAIGGCVDNNISQNQQQSQNITIRMDPSCGCPVGTDQNGVIAVDSAIAIDVNYDAPKSGFYVSISGGSEPYHLWINGVALAGEYQPGQYVDLPGGTYSIYVTDSRGYASPPMTVTLLT